MSGGAGEGTKGVGEVCVSECEDEGQEENVAQVSEYMVEDVQGALEDVEKGGMEGYRGFSACCWG